jgi:hypothetical protein
VSLVTNLTDMATRIGTEFKTIRTLITGSGTGNLTGLTTTAKTSVVAAINEVNAKPSGGTPPDDASETVKGIVELATPAETTLTATDITRAVTPAGGAALAAAIKANILGAGVPAALDTLDELAAAIGDDASYAATISTALGNRLRFDAAQSLTAPQQTQGQANLMVYSRAEIGDPATDFVAAFVAALA